ncbi:MAG: PfkB family carbohydrate kinase, partial [Candidatus Kapaibacterium sp.]
MSVLTITVNPAIDISTNLDHVAPEIKLRCERPGYDPGGGGINVSRVLSRLGVDTTAIFPIGGETGGYLEKLVRDEGISTVTIPYDGRTRQNF